MVYKTEVSEIETKTVREVAEILGVTKQAIFKKIKQLPPELAPEKVNGTYKLSPRTVDFIVSNTQSPTVNANRLSTDNQPVDDEVVAVRLLVEQKDNEIKRLADELTEKNKQINSLHLLIDQQQQLTLQTQFRNNKLELQLEEFKKDESDKTEAIPDDKQTKKKWWHFFNDFL